MNILFVLRSTRPFHYHKSTIIALLERGHSVRALFDYEWSKTKAGSLDVVEALKTEWPKFDYSWGMPRRDWWSKIIFPLREIRSFHHYARRTGQSEYYIERWRRYLPWWLGSVLYRFPGARAVLRSSVIEAVCRRLEALVPADRRIAEELRIRRPDVLVASPVNMRFSSVDLEYLKAARCDGIPSALQVLSWDNLTTKGLIHVHPDVMLVWNDTQAREAIDYHGIAPHSIRLTGASPFDTWFGGIAPTMSKKEFCRSNGLPADASWIVYLGSSGNIAEDETWIVSALRNALDASSDERLAKLWIVARPHPSSFGPYRTFALDRVAVLPREGALPNTADALQFFYHTLYYAVATVGVNTSGMIDAIILGKPGIALMAECYRKTQSETQHFQHLVQADVLDLVQTPEAATVAIGTLLDGIDARAEARVRFVRTFIRPQGGDLLAGEAAARAIEQLGKIL